MHDEPLYRLVVDLREERATFLNRLDPLLDQCEMDGSYLFDCVVENCYGVGKTLDQLTAGLSPEIGGQLMALLEQAWQMVNTAIRHAERQADAQVKHLYPANWIRMRQTQDSLDMYYTQLSPEDPKRQTQVEGIDPEDQAYLDNVIAGEVATEEAVEKAESDMGLIVNGLESKHPGAFDTLRNMYDRQIKQAQIDDFLDEVTANRTIACPPMFTHPDPTVTQEEKDRLFTEAMHRMARREAGRLADKFLGSVAEVVGDRASPAAMQRFAEQYKPEHLYWGQGTFQNNSVLEAKLNEITHPNRDMIERVVREHNARHTPSQSS